MERLAREDAKEAEAAAAERAKKRQKADKVKKSNDVGNDEAEEEALNVANGKDQTGGVSVDAKDDDSEGDEEVAMSPPPKHETQMEENQELSKPNRTIFLSNVSNAAISSKSARKTLLKHLQSFFDDLPAPSPDDPKHAIESLRFRSTPYATAIPKKAAFATKQLMDATAKSTNAYVVYSSQALAREAVKHLNGSVVLDRHLRADSVAHPAKIDHRRCVFVGNLGFVDDESNIQAANEAEGKEKRRPSKQPSDVEEGLWRAFGKIGKVESVRVIRDQTTRVGKGIAYVQFHDEVAVEEALAMDGKKFPPLLPRKLRVSRAKAQKRNSKPASGKAAERPGANGYVRKISSEEASRVGRTGRLYGRAAAAQVKRTGGAESKLGNAIKKPESFVFEGHRAKSGSGKSGLKLGGRKKKGGKVTGRSAAYKSKAKSKK
jgi:nucleolar protein 12